MSLLDEKTRITVIDKNIELKNVKEDTFKYSFRYNFILGIYLTFYNYLCIINIGNE